MKKLIASILFCGLFSCLPGEEETPEYEDITNSATNSTRGVLSAQKIRPSCEYLSSDEEAMIISCKLEDADGEVLPRSLDRAAVSVLLDTNEEVTPEVQLEEIPKDYHFTFPITQEQFSMLYKVTVTIRLDGQEEVFLLSVTADAVVAVLGVDMGVIQFDEQSIEAHPFVFSLNYTGELNAEVDPNFISGVTSEFSFTGGQYPGTNGDCGQSISGPCQLEVQFRPTAPTVLTTNAVSAYRTQIRIPYFNGDETAFLSIDFEGDGRLEATQLYGQVDYDDIGSGTSNSSLNKPSGVFYDGTRLFVVDRDNHRVLIFNSLPSDIGASTPDVVLGQANMNSGSANRGGGANWNTLSSPEKVFSNGSEIYIADRDNHRVVVYLSIPTNQTDAENIGAAGVRILGQENKTDNSFNAGFFVPEQDRLYEPSDVIVSGTKIIVADKSNHRVVVWNSLPGADGADASLVIGQSGFTTGTSGNSNLEFNFPTCVFAHQAGLGVCDFNNSRVMVWNTIPTASTDEADFVIGQSDFGFGGVNQGNANSLSSSLNKPLGASSNGTEILICDTSNERLLIYSALPTTSGANATYVYGQDTFLQYSDTSASNLTVNLPAGCHLTSNKIFVADTDNHRVLHIPFK